MQIDVASPPEAQLFTIAEMSRLHGVSFRTLRFYEQKGLLSPCRMRGQRFYSQKDSLRVGLILTGKKLGFTLTQIDRMLREQIEENGAITNNLDAETMQRQITHLQAERDSVAAAIDELTAALHRTTETAGE